MLIPSYAVVSGSFITELLTGSTSEVVENEKHWCLKDVGTQADRIAFDRCDNTHTVFHPIKANGTKHGGMSTMCK